MGGHSGGAAKAGLGKAAVSLPSLGVDDDIALEASSSGVGGGGGQDVTAMDIDGGGNGCGGQTAGVDMMKKGGRRNFRGRRTATDEDY